MADVDMPDAVPTALAKGKAVAKASKAGNADNAMEGKKRFEVKKVTGFSSEARIRANHIQWNAVALWAWDIVVDNCAICRNHIMDLCDDLRFSIW